MLLVAQQTQELPYPSRK
ncbi:hypothetical protein F7Q95_01925 [Pseudomonas psychrophila]|nr:hypothetical protein F7Q95_01925 [Pseudomonas psychrophila]